MVFCPQARSRNSAYLRTTIANEQRDEFGHLVQDTIRRIESAQFLPHSGIPLSAESLQIAVLYVGLAAFGKQEMADARLTRRPGAESLGWLDELNY